MGERTGVNSALGVALKTEDFAKEVAIGDMFEIDQASLRRRRRRTLDQDLRRPNGW